MALGKIQSQILDALVEAGKLPAEQRDAIAATPEELTGEKLDKLLLEEHRITPFQLLLAKGKAHHLPTYSAARYKIHPGTFERIPQDFCQENLVLPVGEIGDLLLVAFANPFELSVTTKIQEMTGRRVVRMLAREKDIRDKFAKPQEAPTDFADV